MPVVFGTGQSTATITIPIIDDSSVEGIENFQVNLRRVTSFTGNLAITEPTATVTIVDDDSKCISESGLCCSHQGVIT